MTFEFKKEYPDGNIPLFEGEDGVRMLYDVYDGDKHCGEFKILSLGVSQIMRTCEMWKWDITKYSIKRKSDGATVWSGKESVDQST